MVIMRGGRLVFSMGRNYFIAIVCLFISLLAAGFLLVWRNKQTLLGLARLGGASYVEIKPRLAQDTASTTTLHQSKVKTSKTASAEKLPVQWCELEKTIPPGGPVIINEVAWMGGLSSYNDEWIELKNISASGVDLTAWQLINKNQTVKIAIGEDSVLAAGDFFLLERTDENTVPGIMADAVYTGSLTNAKEMLYLFDSQCRVADSIVTAAAWPAGDNASKRTMERRANLQWQTGKDPGGTPKAENSAGFAGRLPVKP